MVWVVRLALSVTTRNETTANEKNQQTAQRKAKNPTIGILIHHKLRYLKGYMVGRAKSSHPWSGRVAVKYMNLAVEET